MVQFWLCRYLVLVWHRYHTSDQSIITATATSLDTGINLFQKIENIHSKIFYSSQTWIIVEVYHRAGGTLTGFGFGSGFGFGLAQVPSCAIRRRRTARNTLMLATGRVGLYKGITITLSFITTCVFDSGPKMQEYCQNIPFLTIVKRCDCPLKNRIVVF